MANQPVKIYDISKDEMRPVVQADVDSLQMAINNMAWIKGFIHRLSAPGMTSKLNSDHRAKFDELLMEVLEHDHSPQTTVP